VSGARLTVDPSRGFGRVCVAGRGLHAESVATAVWAEGGDVDGVAEDYGVSRDEALLCCWWWVTEGALDRGKDRARRTRWKRWTDEQVIQILGGWRKGETLCNPDDYVPEDAS
jgi:uncharacterized protein (DUF433 family)